MLSENALADLIAAIIALEVLQRSEGRNYTRFRDLLRSKLARTPDRDLVERHRREVRKIVDGILKRAD